jgi:Ca2+/Na+ antiporter
MTAAFVVLGGCHMVTGAALRRPVLVLGGVATALLALAPQPAHGSSAEHEVLAGIALIALAVWPVQDGRVGRIAALVLIVLLVAFAISLWTAAATGAWERALTVSQALWPIVAVRRSRRDLG